MSTRIRFLYTFEFDGADAITSSSEDTELYDDNVVTDFVEEKWRTTDVSTEWVKFDLGAATNINCIGIFGHNLTSGATVQIQGNATDSWAGPSYNQTLTWYDERIAYCFAATESYRWWRLYLSDATNPDGYLEIGRICAGVYVEPGVNYRQDYSRRYIDPSEKYETPGRQTYAREKAKYWEYRMGFAALSSTDQTTFETMFDAIGRTKPVVLMADMDSFPSARSHYGEVQEDLQLDGRLVNRADINLIFQEKS